MARIVAGRFETGPEAQRTVDALRQAGFAPDKLAFFEVNPPGQHGMHPIGGDAAHDRGARRSGRGALIGALLAAPLGAAAGWLGGATFAPQWQVIWLLVGIGVFAYVGSLIGAVARARRADPAASTPAEPVSRKAGPLVAVEAEAPERASVARALLIRQDAFEVEEAEGHIRDGRWVDFDPRMPPHLVAPTPRSAAENVISRPQDRKSHA